MKLGRKITGGKYLKRRKKKKYEKLGQEKIVKLGKQEKRKIIKTKGGNKKVFLLSGKRINKFIRAKLIQNPKLRKSKGTLKSNLTSKQLKRRDENYCISSKKSQS